MVKNNEIVQQEKRALHTLIKIIESFPQYTITQHMCHIMRTKGDGSTLYEWDTEKFLKSTEKYYDELLNELVIDGEETE